MGDHQHDDLRAEYNFDSMTPLARGKHAERYHKGTNVVLLDSDVHAASPTSEAVNEALRGLLGNDASQPNG